MKTIRSLRTGVVLLAAGAVGLGLIGSGVRAAITDSATATVNASVGSFSCQLSSTDPNMVISNNGHTATLNWPAIESSTAGSDYSNLTVKNTGSIPMIVHWTEATGGTIAWQPAGRMGYTLGTPTMATDLNPLAPGASQAYTNLGFQWAQLTNPDLGQTASVSYTASCSEVPAAPQSKISYIGGTNATFTATQTQTLTLPSGAAAGDMVITYSQGSGSPAAPTGYTVVGPGSPYRTYAVVTDHVLTASDITTGTVTFPTGKAQGDEILVYRGVKAIGNTGVSGYSALTVYIPAGLAVTNGTSWVLAIGGGSSTNFSYNTGYFTAAPMTLRSGSFPNTKTGASDTGGGVSAVPFESSISSGTGISVPFTMELEST